MQRKEVAIMTVLALVVVSHANNCGPNTVPAINYPCVANACPPSCLDPNPEECEAGVCPSGGCVCKKGFLRVTDRNSDCVCKSNCPVRE